MKMLLATDIPDERFNGLGRAATAGETRAKILKHLKPEAVYFTEVHGRRAG